MYLFYVFNGNDWEFYESVKWSEATVAVLDGIMMDITDYLNVLNNTHSDTKFINIPRFIYDMIKYRQYLDQHLSVYFVDMPG